MLEFVNIEYTSNINNKTIIRIFNNITSLGLTLDFQIIIFKIMSNHCGNIIYTLNII